MAETRTARVGLPQWSVGLDGPSRADFNEAFSQLENLTAIDAFGTRLNRPAPGRRGTYYTATDTGVRYRDNGASWDVMGAVVIPDAPGSVAQTIKGAPGQATNLTEWRDSNNNLGASIGSDGTGRFFGGSFAYVPYGVFSFGDDDGGGFRAQSRATGSPAARIRGLAGQTADLLQVQRNDGFNLLKVSADGGLTGAASAYFAGTVYAGAGGNGTLSGRYVQSPDLTGTYLQLDPSGPASFYSRLAGVTPLVVVGATGQAADLQRWQRADGYVMGRIDALGRPSFGERSVYNGDLTVASSIKVVNGTSGNASLDVQGNGQVSGAIISLGIVATDSVNNRYWSMFVGGGNVSGQGGNADAEGSLQLTEQYGAAGALLPRWGVRRGGYAWVRAVPGQTADLLQVQRNDGFNLLKVSADGGLTTSNSALFGGTVYAGGGGLSGSFAGRFYQSPDLSGTYLQLDPSGNASFYSRLAGVTPLVVVGATGQAADLQRWYAAGINVASVNPDGTLYGQRLSIANRGLTGTDNASYGIVGVTSPANLSTAYYSMTANNVIVFGIGMGPDNVMRVGQVYNGGSMSATALKISADGGLTAGGGGALATTDNIIVARRAGGSSEAYLHPGGPLNGGYVAFTGPNGVRSGYIGYAFANSSGDGAELYYVAGRHTFNNLITVPRLSLEAFGASANSLYTWNASDANWRIGMSPDNGQVYGIGASFTRSFATSHVQYVTYGPGAGTGFAVGPAGGFAHLEIEASTGQMYVRNTINTGRNSGVNGSTGLYLASWSGNYTTGLVADAASASLRFNVNPTDGGGDVYLRAIYKPGHSPDQVFLDTVRADGQVIHTVSGNRGLVGIGVGNINPQAQLSVAGTSERDVQQWILGGAVRVKVDQFGRLQVNPSNTRDTVGGYIDTALGVSTRIPGAVGLVVQGLPGQFADLQQWVNDGGATQARVTATGSIQIAGPLQVLHGANGDDFSLVGSQLLFGWQKSPLYQHGIRTRHNDASRSSNAIDFYVWNPGDAIDVAGSRRVLTLDAAGSELFSNLKVGTGVASPTLTLQGASGTSTLTVASNPNSAGDAILLLTASGTNNIAAVRFGNATSQISTNTNNGGRIDYVSGSGHAFGSYVGSQDLIKFFDAPGVLQGRITPDARSLYMSGRIGAGTQWNTGQPAALAVGSVVPGETALLIKAMAGQTSNLQQWVDSNGSVLGRVDASGTITVGSATWSGPGTGSVALTNGGGGQAGYVQFIQPNGTRAGYIGYANTLATAADTGVISYAAGSHQFNSVVGAQYLVANILAPGGVVGDGSALQITGQGAGYPAATIRNGPGNNGDLLRLQNNAGLTLAKFDGGGGLLNAGLADVVVTGSYLLTNPATAYYGALLAVTRSAGNKGLVVQGVAGQTSNLQEWQNSAGGGVAQVTASGNAVFAAAAIGSAVASNFYVDTANVAVRAPQGGDVYLQSFNGNFLFARFGSASALIAAPLRTYGTVRVSTSDAPSTSTGIDLLLEALMS